MEALTAGRHSRPRRNEGGHHAAGSNVLSRPGRAGHLVEVETDVSDGLPATILVGLPDTALREARDRIRAAIVNSGQDWPKRKITIGLTPANLPKRGSGFDLAIAMALLAANGVIPVTAPKGILFLAELGLDGRLRPVPGVAPAVEAAVAAGVTTVVVAEENKAEAGRGNDVRVVSADSLAQIIEWLRGGPGPVTTSGPPTPPVRFSPQPDFQDYPGTQQARLAAEICAAGGHDLSITGRVGTGKLGLAERLPGILPDLSKGDAFVVTSMHEGAGAMRWGQEEITRPPFVHPHHTCSVSAMIGGGCLTRPGAVSLAQRGVLLLEDAPEFSRDVLDTLRHPLETGRVTLKPADRQARTFPARFQLVMTATPCSCGAPSDEACKCSAAVRRRYLGRLAGPLLEQAEVKVRLEPASPDQVREWLRSAESSKVIAERVAEARMRSAKRLEGTPWRVNAEIPCREMRQSYRPESGASREVERSLELGCVSERGVGQTLRVAWTVADLAGRDRPGKGEMHTALHLVRNVPERH